MDVIMIICVLLFILFLAVSLREWYKYSQEKQRLMRKVENITLFGKHDVIKSESTYTKFLKKIFKYVDDFSDLGDRKSTRLNSSHVSISYAVLCLNQKKE